VQTYAAARIEGIVRIRFIPSGLGLSEAVDIARELGCRIDAVPGTDEIRLSHPLIGRSVRMNRFGRNVTRATISLLREIAALGVYSKARSY